MSDLTKEAIDRISQLAGQNRAPQIMTVDHGESGETLTFLLYSNEEGGTNYLELTKDLAAFDETPRVIDTVARMDHLDSLIDYVNRFKNDDSALFGERIGNNETLKISAVIDYHDSINEFALIDPETGNTTLTTPSEKPKPRHCRHRVTHTFPLSDEIRAWGKIAAKPLELLEFALFLEDNILDVLPLPGFLISEAEKPVTDSDKRLAELIHKLDGNPCGPQKLMELSKGLQINEDTKAKVIIDRNTGEQAIGFETEHEDAEGNKLSVPNMFLIAIPIFEGGEPYRIPVRLRYRKKGGSLAWLIEPYQLDRYIKHAFSEACQIAAQQTALPLFFGRPDNK
ncbi:DUF2303 family protein [uncultured Cohaesibacter sp.]|uniref:DUF2303 family protein n=1 Tax=uncultured Cohaesibacter sp. TaxID=1002546 RepID=UPI0029C8D8EC|nr:DUF2303 family protein [uncultured Cohaesibacter sp.]